MIRFLCLILLGLAGLTALPASQSRGDTYAEGHVDGDYTYRGGYWWSGDKAYSRSLVSYTYYAPVTINGCYYPNYQRTGYRYEYTYHHAREYEQPKVKLPSYKDPNWRTQLLDIAASRDKIEGDLRKSAQEHNEYLEAVQALGLTGNFRWQGYGASPVWPQGYRAGAGYGYGLGNSESIQFGSHGYMGNTIYGYSTQAAAELYGSTDTNALYQQAAKLTQGAQGLAEQANRDFSGLVGQAGDNKARVAEILARAAAAREALQAAAGPPETRIRTQSSGFKVMPQAVQQAPTEPVVGVNNPLIQWQEHAQARCASCHGKADNHGFDVSTYPTMEHEQKLRVWGYLMSKNPDRRCPKSPDGGPGVALTPAELKLWFSN